MFKLLGRVLIHVTEPIPQNVGILRMKLSLKLLFPYRLMEKRQTVCRFAAGRRSAQISYFVYCFRRKVSISRFSSPACELSS